MSIIEQKDGKHILETRPNHNEPQYTSHYTTPNPYLKYNPKFGRQAHKPRTYVQSNIHPNKFFYSKQLTTTPTTTALTTSPTTTTTSSPTLPREKRFVALAAAITGVLGTFLDYLTNMKSIISDLQCLICKANTTS